MACRLCRVESVMEPQVKVSVQSLVATTSFEAAEAAVFPFFRGEED